MARTIGQLTREEITWIDGYVRGDPVRFEAVVLGHFEGRSVREVERATGMARGSVQRLLEGFAPAYKDWCGRRARMDEIVVEPIAA